MHNEQKPNYNYYWNGFKRAYNNSVGFGIERYGEKMKKLIPFFLLILMLAGCPNSAYIEKSLQDAAIAVKIADERLDDLMPIISEKITLQVKEVCTEQQECERMWQERMMDVEYAITALELAKDALLKFETLYTEMREGKKKHSVATLLSKAAEVVRFLEDAFTRLSAADVPVDEVAEALGLMTRIKSFLQGGNHE